MGRDGGHSKGMPKLSSVSSSDEKLGMLSSESKFCISGSELGGDGNCILGQGVWADYQNLLVVWVLEEKVMVIEWNVVGVWYLVRKVKVKEYLIHFEESYQNLLVVWVLEKKAMVMERKVVGVGYW